MTDDPLRVLVELGLAYAEAEAVYDLAGQTPEYRPVLREMALRGDMRLTANQRRHLSGRSPSPDPTPWAAVRERREEHVVSDAYRAMIEHAAAALVFESMDEFTPAQARVLADIVLQETLPRLADHVAATVACKCLDCWYQDGVDDAIQALRTLSPKSARGDSRTSGGAA